MKQALLVLILMGFVPSSQNVCAQSYDAHIGIQTDTRRNLSFEQVPTFAPKNRVKYLEMLSLQLGPKITEFKNGVPVSNLSGVRGSEKLYRLSVPPGASDLILTIAGGTGDADLYVKFGGSPTTSSYDCRPLISGNNETCSMATAKAGYWYVLIRGYKDYSGLTLFGSYLVSPPTGGIELIQNGGFEGGSSPWVLSPGTTYLVSSTSSRGGSGGHVALGQAHSTTRTAYQQFTIPNTATSAKLTFFLSVASEETRGSYQWDKLFVEVRNSSGSLLSTLAVFSNLNKGVNYIKKGDFSLWNYRGQTVRVQFRATNDSSMVTNFRIDDVSVK